MAEGDGSGTEADEHPIALAKWNRGEMGWKLSPRDPGPCHRAERTTFTPTHRDYVSYHHEDRIHDSLDKDTPDKRAIERKPAATAKVISMPRLGGLHHRYAWHEAA